MAEFCLECFNKYINTGKAVTEDEVYMQYDICESCKQNKLCVMYIKNNDTIEGVDNEN